MITALMPVIGISGKSRSVEGDIDKNQGKHNIFCHIVGGKRWGQGGFTEKTYNYLFKIPLNPLFSKRESAQKPILYLSPTDS